MMHGREKSDPSIVAVKPVNDGGQPPAELVEPREGTEGNTIEPPTHRTQGRTSVSHGLDRVRRAATDRKGEPFTALLHHVDVALLRSAYGWLRKAASAGVDGVTWDAYGEGLECKLVDLHDRIHRGAYRAQPSRRVFIPKPDGRQRPLGIASLEDKIVQRALVEVLNAIWEEDFLGFSYGFRPGRGQHDALDALAVGINRCKVNWVLDGDIAGFFDAVDHERLMRFVEHRIADPRVLDLIRKWLKAGVMEDDVVTPGDGGHATRRGDLAVTGEHLPALTSSICGRTNGGNAMPMGTSSSCATPTTSSSVSSTRPMPSGSWMKCARGWRRSL